MKPIVAGPKLRIILVVLAVFYVLSPIDLIPDFLGFAGRIDDLLLMLYLLWSFKQGRPAARPTSSRVEPGPTVRAAPFDPYAVLELKPGAARDEIDENYRRLMREYHPDKVAHLGAELKAVAHEKTLAIGRAYEELTKARKRSA